jgi:hypothetical protein
MKSKIFPACLFAALFLAGCGARYYDRVISNQSSVKVSYVYDGKREELESAASRLYSVTLAAKAPSSVEYSPVLVHPKAVVMKSEGWDYIFEDAPKYSLKVTNMMNIKVTISNEYINADETPGTDNDTSFTLEIGDSTPTSPQPVIYTANPVFTVTTSGTKARAEWEIKPDAGTMTCFVYIVAAE